MTNRMIKRKVFYIQLKLISPLSVSSGEDEWTDSDVLRDGTGKTICCRKFPGWCNESLSAKKRNMNHA